MPRNTLTQDEFNNRIKEMYGQKYSIKDSIYKNNKTKLNILCLKHNKNIFVEPYRLLRGDECCCDCSKEKQHKLQPKDEEIFLEECKKVHKNEKLDYTNTHYVNARTKIEVYCKEKDECGEEHGIFSVLPSNHLRGDKCPKCASQYKENRITKEKFIERSKQLFGNIFDYSKIEHINNNKQYVSLVFNKKVYNVRVCNHLNGVLPRDIRSFLQRNTKKEDFKIKALALIRDKYGEKYTINEKTLKNKNEPIELCCKKHGTFKRKLDSLLKGHECDRCLWEEGNFKFCNFNHNKEAFIQHSKILYGDRFNYDNMLFKEDNDKLLIECKKHGVFLTTKQKHNNEKYGGCKLCANEAIAKSKIKGTKSDFIDNAKKLYDSFYSYSNVEWNGMTSEVEIICPKHGSFFMTPSNHLNGKICPKCKSSKLEQKMMTFLFKNNINFIHNINKKHFKWLGLQRLDFYLPDYNTAIECQGRQHFMLIEQYNEKDKLEKQIKLDAEKKKKCEDNNVRLLYYAELEYDYPYKVFTDLDKLLKEIKNGK